MDALRSMLEQVLDDQRHPRCRVAEIRAAMDPETAAMFDRVLASDASTMRIHRELAKAGVRTARTTLQNHRLGQCGCTA